MNREILFRGKRADNLNDEWVYGSLIVEPIMPAGRNSSDTYWMDFYPEGIRHTCQLKPETIGQYTGLNDSRGERIFEGDLLCYTASHICDLIVDYKDGCFIGISPFMIYPIIQLQQVPDFKSMIIVGNKFENQDIHFRKPIL